MDIAECCPSHSEKFHLSVPVSAAAGMDFSARHADYNFCFGKGVGNTPTAFAPTAARLTERLKNTVAAKVQRTYHGYCR